MNAKRMNEANLYENFCTTGHLCYATLFQSIHQDGIYPYPNSNILGQYLQQILSGELMAHVRTLEQ